MGISLTIFDNVYDNKTIKRMDYESFEQFESVLPNSKVVTKALGISATIPEKIINDIPFPIPL